MPDLAERRRRARFRAWRRGFREADLVLGGFADAHLDSMTETELSAFETLLDQGDHDLWGWICGTRTPDEALAGDLLARLRAFRPLPGAPG